MCQKQHGESYLQLCFVTARCPSLYTEKQILSVGLGEYITHELWEGWQAMWSALSSTVEDWSWQILFWVLLGTACWVLFYLLLPWPSWERWELLKTHTEGPRTERQKEGCNSHTLIVPFFPSLTTRILVVHTGVGSRGGAALTLTSLDPTVVNNPCPQCSSCRVGSHVFLWVLQGSAYVGHSIWQSELFMLHRL